MSRSSDDSATRGFQIDLDRLPVILYIADPHDVGSVRYQSPQVLDRLGFTPEEWLADPTYWQTRLHPDDRERVRRSDEEANRTGASFTIEYRLIAKDGSIVWVRDSGVLIRGDDDEPLWWQGVTSDITEKKLAEERAAENERRFRTLVEQIPAVVFQKTLVESFAAIYVTQKVEDLLGYTPEEWRSDPDFWRNMLHPEDRDAVIAEVRRTSETDEPFLMEYRMYARDGRVVWVREETVLVRDDDGNPKYRQGVMFDITEQKALQEQLSYQALHDALTALPNRSHFSRVLADALETMSGNETTVAVLYLDLDDFKEINDSFGHQVGDAFLTATGKRLRAAIRSDDIVARFGGDEFVILLRSVTREIAEQSARRILGILDQPFTIADHTMRSRCSIGIALAQSQNVSPDELLRQADIAMYLVKARGKSDYAVFDPALDANMISYIKSRGAERD